MAGVVETGTFLVPADGFADARAMLLLGLEPERFCELQMQLEYGEWLMVRHRAHISLKGMRRLAELCGSELRFEAMAEDQRPDGGGQRSRLIEWELENER